MLLHFARNVDGTRTRPDLTTRETEAEAVTYLLCAQLGIAGTEASVEYIQSYRGTPDTLDASLERIRATAQRLSTELDAIRFDAERDPQPGVAGYRSLHNRRVKAFRGATNARARQLRCRRPESR